MATVKEKLLQRKAKLEAQLRVENERQKKRDATRRTRALILLGLGTLELIASGRGSEKVLDAIREQGGFLAKERGQEFDYSMYVQKELATLRKKSARSQAEIVQFQPVEDDLS